MRVAKHTDIRAFNRFSSRIYQGEPGYIDNNSSLIALLCKPNTSFYQHSKQQMICVKEEGETLCQAVLMMHDQAREMSIGFFDAKPDVPDAVALMLEYAEQVARSWNADRIVIGLAGHCNNAVGFPIHPHPPISFGENYGKAYYHDYFKNYERVKLVSYRKDLADISGKLQSDIDRIAHRTQDISLEPADFSRKGFPDSIARYTDLNNLIFENHKYYYRRSYEEDLELFGSMKPLLDPVNLIFARKGEQDIGFVLWYPDFNQLVPTGGKAGVLTYIRYRILRQFPKRGKLVEIGLLPQYKRSGVVALLFFAALTAAGKRYATMITSWILEENLPSDLATKRYADEPYKEYCTYEKNL